jgi:hypothetical protein
MTTSSEWRFRPIEERLWDRIKRTPSGCWEFQGARNGRLKYGNLSFRGRYQPAHRVAYELTNGAIPEGLVVMHSCDNPPCINPEHLSLGTIADNNADRDRKGRGYIPTGGEQFHRDKTHCPAGHPYAGEHLRVRPNGHRYCRTCANQHRRERRSAARERGAA